MRNFVEPDLPSRITKLIKSRSAKLVAVGAVVASLIGFIVNVRALFEMLSQSRLIKALSYQMPVWMLLVSIIAVIAVAVLVLLRQFRNKASSADARLIENNGQFLQRLQEMLGNARERVLVIGLKKDWVFPLIISIFAARSKGVDIDVIYYYSNHERYRLLSLLGCKVYYSDGDKLELPVKGAIADPEQILNCCAVLLNPREKEHIFATYYEGPPDYYAIRAVYGRSCEIIKTASQQDIDETPGKISDEFIPELTSIDEDELIRRMGRVKFYESARITCEDVRVTDVHPVANHVVKFKLNQIGLLLKIYDQKGWKLFRPCAIKLKNGKHSIVIPPVLEEHNGKLYIIEGHSRFYLLRQMRRETSINAVVVRGVTKELPVEPTEWDHINEVDEKIPLRKRELWRHIETTVHQDAWAKDG